MISMSRLFFCTAGWWRAFRRLSTCPSRRCLSRQPGPVLGAEPHPLQPQPRCSPTDPSSRLAAQPWPLPAHESLRLVCSSTTAAGCAWKTLTLPGPHRALVRGRRAGAKAEEAGQLQQEQQMPTVQVPTVRQRRANALSMTLRSSPQSSPCLAAQSAASKQVVEAVRLRDQRAPLTRAASLRVLALQSPRKPTTPRQRRVVVRTAWRTTRMAVRTRSWTTRRTQRPSQKRLRTSSRSPGRLSKR
jgi:hypothetical protein